MHLSKVILWLSGLRSNTQAVQLVSLFSKLPVTCCVWTKLQVTQSLVVKWTPVTTQRLTTTQLYSMSMSGSLFFQFVDFKLPFTLNSLSLSFLCATYTLFMLQGKLFLLKEDHLHGKQANIHLDIKFQSCSNDLFPSTFWNCHLRK